MATEAASSTTPPMSHMMESPNPAEQEAFAHAAAAQQQAMAAAYQYSEANGAAGLYGAYAPYGYGGPTAGMMPNMSTPMGPEEMGYPPNAAAAYYAPYAGMGATSAGMGQIPTMQMGGGYFGAGSVAGYPGPAYYDPYGMLNPATCVAPVTAQQGISSSKKKSKKNGNRFCCC